ISRELTRQAQDSLPLVIPVWSKNSSSLPGGMVNGSQMWLMGHMERTVYFLIKQWSLSRRLVCSGWTVREVDNTNCDAVLSNPYTSS
ncbi:MAG: hypothetical protein V3T42_11550, partial [Nitrospirales bacterium]